MINSAQIIGFLLVSGNFRTGDCENSFLSETGKGKVNHSQGDTASKNSAFDFGEDQEYFPYGETWVHNKATSEQSSTPYKFTSKELDEETGLYYYGHRYRDPKLGGWLSADKFIANGKYLPTIDNNQNLPGLGGVFNSINIDAYHYAGNNPVKFVDPDGNEDILFIQIPGKEGRFESKAYAFPDGTFNDTNLSLLKMDYSIFGNFVSIDFLVKVNIGSNYKAFDDFSTLPDDTTKWGTVAADKLYDFNYNPNWKPKNSKAAYLLTDSSLGNGKVPQDSKYGNTKKGIGKNPAFNDGRTSIRGAHGHKAYWKEGRGWGGSKACPIQKGFDDAPGGLHPYLESIPTGKQNKAIILRK